MFNSADASFAPLVESDCTTSTTSLLVECKVEAESLFSTPFDQAAKDTFTIKVSAINLYGDSPISIASNV